MSLDNKIAIITGGSRGIGRAIALCFAQEGAKIAVAGRNKTRCDDVVTQILKNGGNAISVQADVASEANVAKMIERTMGKYQRIDILVNSAGVNLPYRTVIDLTLDKWEWVLGINLTGTFICCRAVLPRMIAQRYGKIINLSSLGGRTGAAGRAAYRASKAAIINFTECLAAEVKEFDINVNAICPAAVDTDMLREVTGSEIPIYAIPPEDIAAIATFLASDKSRAITGTAIDVFGRHNPFWGVAPSFADRNK